MHLFCLFLKLSSQLEVAHEINEDANWWHKLGELPHLLYWWDSKLESKHPALILWAIGLVWCEVHQPEVLTLGVPSWPSKDLHRKIVSVHVSSEQEDGILQKATWLTLADQQWVLNQIWREGHSIVTKWTSLTYFAMNMSVDLHCVSIVRWPQVCDRLWRHPVGHFIPHYVLTCDVIYSLLVMGGLCKIWTLLTEAVIFFNGAYIPCPILTSAVWLNRLWDPGETLVTRGHRQGKRKGGPGQE